LRNSLSLTGNSLFETAGEASLTMPEDYPSALVPGIDEDQWRSRATGYFKACEGADYRMKFRFHRFADVVRDAMFQACPATMRLLALVV
jgi:hypothetical protein